MKDIDPDTDDEVDIPVEKVRGKYRLDDLVARMPRGYVPREKDWGEPVGREVWFH